MSLEAELKGTLLQQQTMLTLCCLLLVAASQVVLWDLAGEWERVARQREARGEEGEEGAAVPVVRHKWASAVEHSHNTQVSQAAALGQAPQGGLGAGLL